MADIFISYARADQTVAAPLAGALQAFGWSVFWDRRIPAGRRFDQFIDEQLASARCVIVLWSKAGIGSDWVIEEAARGRERKILVPARIEAVSPPLGFSRIHAADLIGWDGAAGHDGLKRLIEDIEAVIGRPAAPIAPEAPPLPPSSQPVVSVSTSRPYARPWPVVAMVALTLVGVVGGWLILDRLLPPVTSRKSPVETTSQPEAKPAEKAQKPAAVAETKPQLPAAIQRMPRVGETFRDCDICPEMVVVPAGSFLMGSPDSDKDSGDGERPQHHVTIGKSFAIGTYEVTFDEWDACVGAGGCASYRPIDADWGRGSRPVIDISWQDAQGYLDWLSRKTGKGYRLPTEAEWEYAARAGATTRYAVGDQIMVKDANFFDSQPGKTVPVGSYAANPWGLYDVHGNVWEWVEDCYHDSYRGAPADGRAWVENSCTLRVVRGGSWINDPGYLRSAFREGFEPDYRDTILGFRVARTLP